MHNFRMLNNHSIHKRQGRGQYDNTQPIFQIGCYEANQGYICKGGIDRMHMEYY